MGQPRVEKIRSGAVHRLSIRVVFDNAFFVFGGVATVWLAWLVLRESLHNFRWSWWLIVVFVLFWVVLAYLALPRLNLILSSIYVPNYFIGRTRTSDGLLGDAINLAYLGSEQQLTAAMRAAGWLRADPVTLLSSWRIVTSTLLRRSYDEAPVSPLLLFGRQQDFAYQQEVRGNPARRHHVRFWRCPDDWLLPGGHRADWLAAGTFDRRVGFSLFTLQITHKIDANTDVERDHIVSTLLGARLGISVRLIRDFSTGYHSRNGGGDAIETDGDLPIIELSEVPIPGLKGTVATPSLHANERSDVAGTPPGADSPPGTAHDKRPVQSTLGSALMGVRVLAGIVFLAIAVGNWRRLIDDETAATRSRLPQASPATVALVAAIVLGILAATLGLYLVLAALTLRGSNWARFTAMVFSSILILVTAVNYFGGGPEITLRTSLPGLSLDILVLLALSSSSAREWAMRPRQSIAENGNIGGPRDG